MKPTCEHCDPGSGEPVCDSVASHLHPDPEGPIPICEYHACESCKEGVE